MKCFKINEKNYKYNLSKNLSCNINNNGQSYVKYNGYKFCIDSALYGLVRNHSNEFIVLDNVYRFTFEKKLFVALFISDLKMTTSRPISKILIFEYRNKNIYNILNEWQCDSDLSGLGYTTHNAIQLVFFINKCDSAHHLFVYRNGRFHEENLKK